MRLNNLTPNAGSRKNSRRLGRGFSRGKTCGRGHKGYKSRSGSSVPASFEGGQMPLQRRLPKNGFAYVHRLRDHEELAYYKLSSVLKTLSGKVEITLPFLVSHKLISMRTLSCKIFGTSTEALPKAITALSLGKGVRSSKQLQTKLEKLG